MLILSLDNNLRLHIHINITFHKCHRPISRPPGLYGGNCFCQVHKTHHAGWDYPLQVNHDDNDYNDDYDGGGSDEYDHYDYDDDDDDDVDDDDDDDDDNGGGADE